MAYEGLEVDPDRPSSADGATEPDGGAADVSSEDTVEAVRAVILAAIDVGRQVLDAVERTLRDPATAEKLGDLVAGLAGAAEGLRPIVEVKGFRTRAGPPPVEHITIDDLLDDGRFEDGPGEDGEAP